MKRKKLYFRRSVALISVRTKKLLDVTEPHEYDTEPTFAGKKVATDGHLIFCK